MHSTPGTALRGTNTYCLHHGGECSTESNKQLDATLFQQTIFSATLLDTAAVVYIKIDFVTKKYRARKRGHNVGSRREIARHREIEEPANRLNVWPNRPNP